jgi:hypothetical protein
LDPARNLDPRRRADGRIHAPDRTTDQDSGPPSGSVVRSLRVPAWDWSFAEDGALALDRAEAWDDPRAAPLHPHATVTRLMPRRGSDTVPPMSPPQAPGRAVRHRPHRQHQEASRRRLAVLAVIAFVGAFTVLVTAFSGGGASNTTLSVPAGASRLLPAGPPTPQVISRLGTLHIQLPVNQSRVTALGYSGGDAGALALVPVGSQANEGLLKRLLHKAVGGGSGSPHWYQLPGGYGPATSALDVGAAPGTDVYSPVDGAIVGISKVVLNGRVYGRRIDIQPTDAPSLVISVSRLRPDPSLAVGAMLTAAGSKLGQVLDLSHVEKQVLARYTNDEGNHVLLEVHPAAILPGP